MVTTNQKAIINTHIKTIERNPNITLNIVTKSQGQRERRSKRGPGSF